MNSSLMFIFLLPVCAVAFLGGVLAERSHQASKIQPPPSAATPVAWSVEVLRTSDARGLTYSSLHDASSEPVVQNGAVRWVDDQGRAWFFVNGALAHELDPPVISDQ